VLLAFALTAGSGSSSNGPAPSTAVVSVVAPTPSPDTIEPCAQVLAALPVQLDGNDPRQVHPYPDTGAAAVAWGNPAIVLVCGVPRPPGLAVGSADNAFLVGPVNWFESGDAKTTVFTAVDRAVYIQVTVPKSYQQPPLVTLANAIAQALPAVCHFEADELPTPTASSSPTPSKSPAVAPPSGTPTSPSSTIPASAGPVGPLCTHRP
jgi:hypothetical protein